MSPEQDLALFVWTHSYVFCAVLTCTNLNELLFGCFYPEFFFKIMKVINFRGDLTDNSATNVPLVLLSCESVRSIADTGVHRLRGR